MLLDFDDVDVYSQMIALLTREHPKFNKTTTLLGMTDDPESTLWLHRKRAEAIQTSYFLRQIDSSSFRVRMGGIARVVPSWVALVLNHAFLETDSLKINRDEFGEAWSAIESQHPHSLAEQTVDEGWKALLRVAGSPLASICDIKRVADAVWRGVAADGAFGCEPGRHGPVVGTIHSSKGREALTVMLYLPNDYDQVRTKAGTRETQRDEARVLYVGMSRARHNLILTASTKWSPYKKHRTSGRLCRITTGYVGICELGLRKDLDPALSIKAGGDAGQAILAGKIAGSFDTVQGHLHVPDLDFSTTNEKGEAVRIAAGTNKAASNIGWTLTGDNTADRRSEDVIWHDVSTVALPPSGDDMVGIPEPWRETRLMLLPVFTGTTRWDETE